MALTKSEMGNMVFATAWEDVAGKPAKNEEWLDLAVFAYVVRETQLGLHPSDSRQDNGLPGARVAKQTLPHGVEGVKRVREVLSALSFGYAVLPWSEEIDDAEAEFLDKYGHMAEYFACRGAAQYRRSSDA